MSLSDGAAPNYVMLCEYRTKGSPSIKYQKELLWTGTLACVTLVKEKKYSVQGVLLLLRKVKCLFPACSCYLYFIEMNRIVAIIYVREPVKGMII